MSYGRPVFGKTDGAILDTMTVSLEAVIEANYLRGIRLCLGGRALMATAVLILAGVDYMAYLWMPERTGKRRKLGSTDDFIDWVNIYMKNLPGAVTGRELKDLRDSLFHRGSQLSRNMLHGDGLYERPIGLIGKFGDCTQLALRIWGERFAIVEIEQLMSSFEDGVQACIGDLKSNPDALRMAMKRLEMSVLVDTLTWKDDKRT